ncbi:MAG: fibrobacter succinogenes major paralogous domain-containing protein [Candidatus Magasanikbacteria bacterium]
MLKPDGATCTTATQCSSGICTGNLCVPPPCAYATSTVYSGVTYPLVNIGTKCWFAKNLNVGTRLTYSTYPSNNSLIEKWCYSNSEANCTTYGGLYTWAEANQLATTCNSNFCTPSSPSQGICPSGWHIPTDTEIQTLEIYLGMCAGTGTGCAGASAQLRGTDQGTKLKSGGSSGFNLLLGGGIQYGSFAALGSGAYLWSASESAAQSAYMRSFSAGAQINRYGDTKSHGSSVRCLKN